MLSKFESGIGEWKLRNPTFADGPFSLELGSIRAYTEQELALAMVGWCWLTLS
jgi:hypothetical protein